jgi:hypothetical protein
VKDPAERARILIPDAKSNLIDGVVALKAVVRADAESFRDAETKTLE